MKAFIGDKFDGFKDASPQMNNKSILTFLKVGILLVLNHKITSKCDLNIVFIEIESFFYFVLFLSEMR